VSAVAIVTRKSPSPSRAPRNRQNHGKKPAKAGDIPKMAGKKPGAKRRGNDERSAKLSVVEGHRTKRLKYTAALAKRESERHEVKAAEMAAAREAAALAVERRRAAQNESLDDILDALE
jgi:hypothetical protein